MKRKLLCEFVFIMIICLVISINCFAITEAEVQAAVDSSSKQTLSGNILVWFLCAIAFMKVSQKIDTFISSLGVSVGRTGGSLIGEAMIAGRAIGTGFKMAGKFTGFGKGASSGGGGGSATAAGRGGFFGSIGRKVTTAAAGAMTGGESSGGGGIMASIGKRMYQNSVGKGGSFATKVIGSVARGEINKMGTISGSAGKAAMESYFGYNASASVDKKEENASSLSVDQGGQTTLSSEENVNGSIDVTGGTIPVFSNGETGDTNVVTGAENIGIVDVAGERIPTFSEIEMGGGRITGIETTGEHPDGIQFAMYDAEKYTKPEGNFETVIAVDNSKWYKQYAAPAVEKTPYMDTKGKVQYNEKIVQKIPQAPMRKDKM